MTGRAAATGVAFPWRLPWRRPRRIPATVYAAAVLVTLALTVTILADIVRPLDTHTVDFDEALAAPSLAHPMGTDEVGRDLLARVVHGLRLSLLVSLGAATVATMIGSLVGLLAGSFGRWVDAVTMRILDMFASQNHLVFGIVLAVVFRPWLGPLGAVLLSVGATHWISIARIVRGEMLALREQPYVAASINGGAGRLHLVRRHYLPHLSASIGLGFVLLFPHAVFHESALSFLGVGLPAHQASLGNILADARRSLLAGIWWTSLFPGAVLFAMTISVATIGDYLRKRLNPHWRSELRL
jgi:peptide/nickel transport system permease protein